jgi:uncharacterized protein YqgQ
MANNILFFTALKANDPNMNAYQEWSLKTWQYYADKYGHKLVVLTDPLYDTEWMRPTWQRWYVYQILEHNNIEYDQVALIDIDTMVRWDTPDIFELSEGKYTGVIDDLSIEWLYNSIEGYKEYFPDVNLQWDKYINNGVLVLPKEEGKEFCEKVIDFYLTNVDSLRDKQHHSLKKGTDQTPINYLALQTFGNNIKYISKKYNMTHMYKTHAFIEDIYIKCSYIWHFNGLPREQRNDYMRYTWEKIKHHYVD